MSQEIHQDRRGIKIVFKYNKNAIRIYKEVVEKLGYPRFIQLLINPEEKKLYIVGTNQSGASSIEVPEISLFPHQGFLLHGSMFIRKIFRFMLWEQNYTYSVTGLYSAEKDVIIFNLSDAVMTKPVIRP